MTLKMGGGRDADTVMWSLVMSLSKWRQNTFHNRSEMKLKHPFGSSWYNVVLRLLNLNSAMYYLIMGMYAKRHRFFLSLCKHLSVCLQTSDVIGQQFDMDLFCRVQRMAYKISQICMEPKWKKFLPIFPSLLGLCFYCSASALQWVDWDTENQYLLDFCI